MSSKTRANVHLLQQYVFLHILTNFQTNHFVVSVEMELTICWRRVLVLSFLMIGASICLPSIRKGEQESWGSSLSKRPSPVSCMTLWLSRWSLITVVDIFSEASHWGIPGRSPSPDAKRSAHLPGADVEWVTNGMQTFQCHHLTDKLLLTRYKNSL